MPALLPVAEISGIPKNVRSQFCIYECWRTLASILAMLPDEVVSKRSAPPGYRIKPKDVVRAFAREYGGPM